ncbi:translation initiation factor [Stylonychia lemnae]|uniref:Translation initiation factor n=1 Tax=Stylonychia lemnae TaxID=5949 RepID=A0A078AGM8_STYLE|nr:translation initiation factor [Stylonychia lemnae]|eukprot:CDW81435.1 translation initiation factor [Stylonychia lemnae]
MEDPQSKKGAKKGAKKITKADNDDSTAGELQFGGNMELVNFGGGATNDELGEEFNDKQREPNVIHLHYQQRTARKCLTIIQGLPDDLDYKKILRAYKKLFNCSGTIVEDEEMGTVIQLQGDKRKDVAKFLLEEGIATIEEIKIHGY